MEVAASAADIDFDNLKFDEDWQMSQFWYDGATAAALAAACIKAAGGEGGRGVIQQKRKLARVLNKLNICFNAIICDDQKQCFMQTVYIF